MPKLNISQQKRAAKLAYRQLVQDSARGNEVDPDSVEQTLLLAGKSWDDLERDVTALETALADESAFQAKGYETKIAELAEVRTEAAAIRKQLEAEQVDFNDRWKQLRAMEERGQHGNTLRYSVKAEQSELVARRKKLLGTLDLTAFPAIS